MTYRCPLPIDGPWHQVFEWKNTDKPGRAAAMEIMLNTTAIANLIRQGKIDQIETAIQSGGGMGMQTMDSALLELANNGLVSGHNAYLQANNKSKFKSLLDDESGIVEPEL